jgi:hypothetical protein
VGAFEDLYRVRVKRARFRQLAREQFGVTHDHGQSVVEVVRDASGQAPERLDFLRVAELSLELRPRLIGHALGVNIGEVQREKRKSSLRVPCRKHVDRCPQAAAVLAQQALLVAMRVHRALRHPLHRVAARQSIVRVRALNRDLVRIGVHDVLPRTQHHPSECFVHEHVAPRRSRHADDADRRMLHRSAEMFCDVRVVVSPVLFHLAPS